MKLEFNDKNMTACCFEIPIDNLKKHYIDFMERNSLYYAISEVMRDYDNDRITASYKDDLLRELTEIGIHKPVVTPPIAVKTSKKSPTKKKPAKRSKKS